MLKPAYPIQNKPGLCGYCMYFYDAIAIANRIQWSLIDTFHVADILFEFTNASYANSGQREANKNYIVLLQSTHTYDRVVFENPFPYSYVY
jgi:hypothetical protein